MKARELARMFGLGAATLVFEVLLTRIAAVTLFANLAFGVIALSLFGLALGSAWAERRVHEDEDARERSIRNALLTAAFFTLLSGLLATKLPLVPEELVSRGKVVLSYSARREAFEGDPSQIHWGFIALLVVCQAVPFAMAGYAQARVLSAPGASVAALYAADLGGATLGSLSSLALLRATGAVDGVGFAAVLFVLTAAAGVKLGRRERAICGGALTIAIAAIVARPFDIVHAAGFSEQHIVAVDWSALARIGLYAPDPGAGREDPLLVVDNTSATDVVFARSLRVTHNLERVPFSLRPDGDVLVIGAGGGQEIESALATAPDRKRHVDAIELADGEERLMRRNFGMRADFLLDQPGVSYRIADGRSFLESAHRSWDIIQMKEVNFHSFAGQAASAWTPSLLFTTEAIRTDLEHLTRTGYLAITKGLYFGGEIASSLEMIATLRSAGDPLGRPLGPRLVIVDRARASGLQRLYLVGATPFSDAELDELQSIAREAGLVVRRTPRFPYPPVETLIAAPTMDASAPRPTTDDRPFGQRLQRADDRFLRNGLVFLAFLAVLVIARSTRRVASGRRLTALGHLVTCGLLGIAFMLLEIVLVERVSLLLGHPTVGFVTVVTAMLCGLGAGSIASGAALPGSDRVRAFGLSAATLTGVIALCVLPVVAAGWVRSFDAGIRPWVVGVFAFAAATPLGMLLPSVIRSARLGDSATAAGCWSVNAACSVLGTVGAALLVRGIGFTATGRLACLLYAWAIIGWLWQRRGRVDIQPAPH